MEQDSKNAGKVRQQEELVQQLGGLQLQPSPSATRRKIKEWNTYTSPLQACSSQESQGTAGMASAIKDGGATANDGGDVEALETMKAVVEVDEDGNKSVNEYLLIKTIGKGSFAKVKVRSSLQLTAFALTSRALLNTVVLEHEGQRALRTYSSLVPFSSNEPLSYSFHGHQAMKVCHKAMLAKRRRGIGSTRRLILLFQWIR